MKNKSFSLSLIFWSCLIFLFAISVICCGMQRTGMYINEDNVKYYIFTASAFKQNIVCTVSIAFFILFGFILGLKGKIADFLIFIALMLVFKFAIPISAVVNESFSNFLWGIYTAPISAITDSIDMWNWTIYETLVFVPFVVGIVFDIKTNKSFIKEKNTEGNTGDGSLS